MVGLAIVAANRLINMIIMKCISRSVCLILLGIAVVDILIQLQKKIKDNTSHVCGALHGIVNEYRLRR